MLEYLTKEKRFDNTNNWLSDYISANLEDASAVEVGLKNLDADRRKILTEQLKFKLQ